MKNLTLAIAVALILALTAPAVAKHLHPERWYQCQWAKAHGGITEYRLADGKRVDILTDKYAIEVDFAHKFYEAVGQALLYAARTGKQPGILLILEDPADQKYLANLAEILTYWHLPIQVWAIENFYQ